MSQCYRGVCGGWASYETIIQTEEDRKLWLEADPTLDNCDRSLPFTGCPTQGCGAGCCDGGRVAGVDYEDATVLSGATRCNCANCRCVECIGDHNDSPETHPPNQYPVRRRDESTTWSRLPAALT